MSALARVRPDPGLLSALTPALFRPTVPWETYDLYRSARRLAEGGPDAADVDRALVRSLKRWETLWLVLVCAAPSLAGAAIYGYRTAFPNYDRFLTNFNIALFVLSASARPLRHVFGAAREHAAHVHAELVYPRAEVAELTARVAALEQHLGTLQSRTATHQELEDVQETVKPMLTQVLQAVREMEDRTEQLTRQAEDRLGLVERSLGLVPVPDGSSAYARLQWALIGVGRGLVAAFVSPIVLPIQLAVTTWDVLASPFRGRASLRARTPPAVRGPALNGHTPSAATARGLDALKRTRSASHGVLTGLSASEPL